MSPKGKNASVSRNRSTVRIIGGRFRGRHVPVPDQGVRPTPDRVRETLFNWLTPWIVGSRCLDMFAGTGVLGLEALSRGAHATLFVERDKAVARRIEISLDELGCEGGKVIISDAQRLSYSGMGPFDIVFIDPPFGTIDLAVLCKLLETSGVLAEKAHIYMEMNRRQPVPVVPEGWSIIREQTAGQVRYLLAQRDNGFSDGN